MVLNPQFSRVFKSLLSDNSEPPQSYLLDASPHYIPTCWMPALITFLPAGCQPSLHSYLLDASPHYIPTCWMPALITFLPAGCQPSLHSYLLDASPHYIFYHPPLLVTLLIEGAMPPNPTGNGPEPHGCCPKPHPCWALRTSCSQNPCSSFSRDQ